MRRIPRSAFSPISAAALVLSTSPGAATAASSATAVSASTQAQAEAHVRAHVRDATQRRGRMLEGKACSTLGRGACCDGRCCRCRCCGSLRGGCSGERRQGDRRLAQSGHPRMRGHSMLLSTCHAWRGARAHRDLRVREKCLEELNTRLAARPLAFILLGTSISARGSVRRCAGGREQRSGIHRVHIHILWHHSERRHPRHATRHRGRISRVTRHAIHASVERATEEIVVVRRQPLEQLGVR